jgi:hypothetical protein
MKRAFALCILLAVLLPIGGVMAATRAANGYEVSSYVIGGGGGHSEASPYTLDGTVGQATAGTYILRGPYDECVGFWCWGWHFERECVYLPLVLR